MPAPSAPYPIANDILNSARFRLNDKLKSRYPTGGQILSETDASTHQAFNNAFRRMQNQLADAGVSRFKSEVIIQNIPATKNQDPSSKQSISWFQFFDGTNFQSKPVLPQNLIYPLWMSERWSVARGSVNNWPFPDINTPNMTLMIDGMQNCRKYQFNGQWEWREDTIFFPGAINNEVDFRIGFRIYIPDIVDVGDTRWWNQPVQIINCQDAASKWLCFEFATARSADGDAAEAMIEVAGVFKAEAIEATRILINPDAMREQRTNVRRQPYGQRSGRGCGLY